MASFRPPGQCPVCGEWVRRGQLSCEECGSCARSGWGGDTGADGLDLPDDDFDYDDFIAREFGGGDGGKRLKPPGIPLIWWLAAAAVLAAMLGGLLISLAR
jgi:hypothetical protein